MPTIQEAKKGRRLSLIARIGVATVAIGWVLHGQDWKELIGVFQRLSPWYFALSLVTFLTGQVIIALRWWLLLHAQSIRLALPAVLRLHFLGLFYNNVMPGSVGGDLLKAWYVTKHTPKRLEGALSVFIDRIIGLAGMLAMAILAYMLFLRGRMTTVAAAEPEARPEGQGGHAGLYLVVGLALAAAAALTLLHPAVRTRLRRLAVRLLERAVGLLMRTKTAVVVYLSKPVTLLLTLLLTIVAQSIVIAAFWLLGRNLGMDAGLKHYFVIFPVMWIVAALPISVAGLGVLEVGIVELFVRLTGAVAERALALAFCQRFVWVLASLPGGLIHLLGTHLPRDIFVDAENCVN